MSLNQINQGTVLTPYNTPVNILYEEFSSNFAVSGLSEHTTNLVRVVRVGKIITVNWSSMIGNGEGSQIVLTSLPPRLKPLETITMMCPVLNNGEGSDGNIQIDKDTGNLTFSSNSDFSTFTKAEKGGIFSGSISYVSV